MAIDLDKCVGCSACVAACYIENNVAMSGTRAAPARPRAGVDSPGAVLLEGRSRRRRRARHVPAVRLRAVRAGVPGVRDLSQQRGLERRRSTTAASARVTAATTVRTSSAGSMFSWGQRPHPMNLMTNPDVSMRGKGVMEKCTFCIQRIRQARDVAKDEKRKIQEGDFTTACARRARAKPSRSGICSTRSPSAQVGARPALEAHSGRAGNQPGRLLSEEEGGAEHGA